MQMEKKSLTFNNSVQIRLFAGLPHADAHSNDDLEIKPGIAEMIREEERVSLTHIYMLSIVFPIYFVLFGYLFRVLFDVLFI